MKSTTPHVLRNLKPKKVKDILQYKERNRVVARCLYTLNRLL